MITLTVYQKGGATYTSGISMQFSPQYITKMVESEFGSDSTCTQFEYFQTTYIVAQSLSTTCALITTASTITVTGVSQNNITQTGVAFNLPCVQMVEDVDGYAGIYYTQNDFKATQYALSTGSSDYADIDGVLEAYGFTRCERQLNDGTTRSCFINPLAPQEVIAGTIDSPATYIFPSGSQIVGYTLFTYTSQDFSGISFGDTLNTILTGYGTITLNLPCVTAPNRTAIKTAIETWLNTNGAQYSSVAVTQPSSGTLRIVISNTNVSFTSATATIASSSVTKTFTAS